MLVCLPDFVSEKFKKSINSSFSKEQGDRYKPAEAFEDWRCKVKNFCKNDNKK